MHTGLRTVVMLGAALLLVSAATGFARFMGGWAVVTVHDVPTHLVVGQATTLRFTVRQHGVEPLSGLETSLQVRRSDAGFLTRDERVPARPARGRGVYEATYTPTVAGSVTIRVLTGFRNNDSPLRPIPVVAAGSAQSVAHTPASDPVERGRALYIASGCVTCHVKGDDAALADYDPAPVGPELTGRTWPAEYLVQRILDPTSLPRLSTSSNRMPQLELTPESAQSIATYLNARQVAGR